MNLRIGCLILVLFSLVLSVAAQQNSGTNNSAQPFKTVVLNNTTVTLNGPNGGTGAAPTVLQVTGGNGAFGGSGSGGNGGGIQLTTGVGGSADNQGADGGLAVDSNSRPVTEVTRLAKTALVRPAAPAARSRLPPETEGSLKTDCQDRLAPSPCNRDPGFSVGKSYSRPTAEALALEHRAPTTRWKLSPVAPHWLTAGLSAVPDASRPTSSHSKEH